MTIAVGLLLGAGVLLVFSPVLWPATSSRPPRNGGLGAALVANLAHAGLARVSVATVVVVSLLVSAAALAITFALLPITPIALAAALVGLLLPSVVISLRAASRRRASRLVWPDVVDQLVSAVRAGQSLPDSVASLATSGPLATREPFEAFADDYRATGNFGMCVTELKLSLIHI